MKTEVKKIDKLKRILTVVIEEERLSEDRRKAYSEIGKSLKVSGFRPGTAPLEILEKQHGNVLKEEFLRRNIPVYYKDALADSGLIPASMPRVYDVQLTNKSLTFSAELEVKPELVIDEKDYKGIKIKEDIPEVKAEEVEKAVTNIKEEIKKNSGRDFPDDGLARWAGYPDIAALKETVKTQIFMEKLRERRRKIDSLVSKSLLEKVKTDLPKDEVEERHKELVEREVYYLQSRNIPAEDIDKYKKDIEEKLKPLAEEEVKLFYILEAIAKKENLKIEHNIGETVLGYILSEAKYE